MSCIARRSEEKRRRLPRPDKIESLWVDATPRQFVVSGFIETPRNRRTAAISTDLPGICVFCGSARGDDPAYAQAAREFGTLLAQNGFRLVFGGGRIGLMGEAAAGVTEENGQILGIIPGFLRHLEPPLRAASTIVVTKTLNERKTRMFEAAEGFAVLAGGLGTFDEFFEALTGAQLKQHAKPVVLINTKNYFEPLLGLIEHSIAHGFAAPEIKELITVVDTPQEAIKMFAARRASI